MNLASVCIFCICYCVGVVYSAITNNTQDFQEQNCLENPNGLLTELCGQQSTQDEQGIESSQLEDGFILSKTQKDFLYGRQNDDENEAGQERVVINNKYSDVFELWPTGEKIPYEIDASIDDKKKKAISEAIAEIEKFTCVRFRMREKKKDDYFLKFFKGNGCWSFIGLRKDKEKVGQKVSIGDGCEKKGEVIHQIMHAFGFLNEHTREDRDIYVEINWENILPDKKKYFRISKEFVQNFLGSDYDYNSIMHYSRNKYSKNGKDTMSIFGCSIKAKNILKIIGQRDGLSAGDRFQINKLFKCSVSTKRQSIVNDTLEEASKDSGETIYTCN
ncbi:zinc metalloproteinase nas-6-like [Rhopilema esculentum]|uniref:zinc metalloproteinase nas-6-like n=1 Tax=Rhopilema esculentum TaxID=499914 RepID=UPI0031D5625A|eukprot:gene7037-12665_t